MEDRYDKLAFQLFARIISPSSYVFLPFALLWLILHTQRDNGVDQISFCVIIFYLAWIGVRGLLYGYFMKKSYGFKKWCERKKMKGE